MRILFTVHGYKPAYRIGGPIISVSSLAEKLVEKGHHVTVFTTNSNLDEDLDVPLAQAVDVHGVKVWYFQRTEPFRKFRPFIPYLSKSSGYVYAPSLRRQLEREIESVDVIHTHLPFIYPTMAAAACARKYNKPLFYHQRGVFDPQRLNFRSAKKRTYIRFVELPILQQATTLIALTDAEVNSYRALGAQSPCRVIPNGINVSNYRTRPLAPIPGVKDDDLVVLFLGRVHPVKGADALLEAFLSIRDQFPGAMLVLAGPDEFGLEAKFKDLVASAGMDARVLFPGMVSGEEKLDLLARADLFCLPSAGEGFSMAVLEALASGTAVLLSPGCHFDEVERANCGVVAEPTPSGISGGLATLLRDRDRLRAMGATGRRFVEADYSWDAIADDMVRTYEEGIARRALHASR